MALSLWVLEYAATLVRTPIHLLNHMVAAQCIKIMQIKGQLRNHSMHGCLEAYRSMISPPSHSPQVCTHIVLGPSMSYVIMIQLFVSKKSTLGFWKRWHVTNMPHRSVNYAIQRFLVNNTARMRRFLLKQLTLKEEFAAFLTSHNSCSSVRWELGILLTLTCSDELQSAHHSLQVPVCR